MNILHPPLHKNKLNHFQNLSTLASLTLIITVWATVFFLKYQNDSFKTTNQPTLSPAPTPSETSTANWKSYTNPSSRFEVRYPDEMKQTSTDPQITEISTPNILCKTSTSGETIDVDISELIIDLQIHEGISFENIWRREFGFDFTDNNDGEIEIASYKGYYFYQGAELLYGRKAILVDVGRGNMLEVNIYTPILAYNCTKKLRPSDEINKLTDKIISTIKIDNSPIPGPPTLCLISGCNSEICSDKEMVSACVYKDEFACYKNADCETQSNGKCGWTMDEILVSCIEKYN